MSAISRILSGSAASWSRISVSFLSQILLVPIFLGHWEPSQYGLWIGIFALAGLFQFVDIGHHNYIGFEALRLGERSRKEIAKLYSSAVRVALWLSVLGCLVVISVVLSGFHMHVLGAGGEGNEELSRAVGILLVMQSVSWLVFGNWSSIAGRVLAPFGYFPAIAWWQVSGAIVAALAPALAVQMGAGLLEAGIVHQIGYTIYAIPAVAYVRRMIGKERLAGRHADYKYGLSNLFLSLALSLKYVCDMFRQEQFRIVISPLLGPANLVVFVTTRTVANVLVAGLATVTGPVMPEFMRYLNNRDAARSVAVMSVVWIVVVGILAPVAVAAQVLIAPLFEIWTRGKVSFDPTLFALFSMSVLLSALAQPALSVLQGFNMLRPQVAISIAATAIALIGAVWLAPGFGVKGAAVSLLVGELLASVYSLLLMRLNLRALNIEWPRKQISITLGAIAFSFLLIGVASQTEGNEILVLPAALVCAATASLLLISSQPEDLRALVFKVLRKARAQ